MPQETRRDDVSLLYGNARRGAFDARPGERAPGGPFRQSSEGRVHGKASPRGDGSLSRMQGLQGRMPVERRYGEAQVRVSRPLSRRERFAAEESAVRRHRIVKPPWVQTRAAVELVRQLVSEPMADGNGGRD